MPLKRQPAIDGGTQQTPSPASDPEPITREEESILSQRLVFPDDDVEQELTRMMDAIEVEQKPQSESLPATIDLEVPGVLPLEAMMAQPVSKDGADPHDDNGKALLKAGGIPEPIRESHSPELVNTSSATLLDSDSENPNHNPKETPLGISGFGGKDSLTKKSFIRSGFLLIHSLFSNEGWHSHTYSC